MTRDKFLESHEVCAALKEAEHREYRGVTDLPWYVIALCTYMALAAAIVVIGESANWWR